MTIKTRGELYVEQARRHFSINRLHVKGSLAEHVEYLWIIRWGLPPGKGYTSEVLPYPAINLVFADSKAWVSGVRTAKFTYELQGSGTIVGILFKPGGFYAFWPHPQAALKNTERPFAEIFPALHDDFARILPRLNDEQILKRVTQFLNDQRSIEREPPPSAVGRMIWRIEHDRTIKKVADLSRVEGLSERRIEQLFRVYVGATPKWSIRHRRIHEAAERLTEGNGSDSLAALAYELGYADQAHFSHDFKRIIGRTPVEHMRHSGL